MRDELSLLRTRLKALCRRRAAVRWGSAVCAMVLLMVGLWGVAFLVDWSLRLTAGIRLVVLVGWLGGVLWGLWRFLRPAWGTRETLEEAALVVERQHRIDSDLIAALEFDSPEAATWGSQRLEQAVIQRVGNQASRLDVFAGFTYAPLPQWIAAVVISVLIVTGVSTTSPAHLRAFWNRFWLGSERFPSRTVLKELRVNGQSVPVVGTSSPLRLPQGTPLKIQAQCEGEIPAEGFVRLWSRIDRVETRFEMKQAGDANRFIAEHPLPSGDFELQVFLGDTWSDPVSIRVVPLPMVDLVWQVTPPAYARRLIGQETRVGAGEVTVLEGSELKLTVRGTNKGLSRVALQAGDDERVPLEARGSGREAIWSLPSGPPWNEVRKEFSYVVHVEDEDGLSMSPPPSGGVRLQADRPPRVASAMVTKLVIPTARPRLAYGAVDDYGLKQIRVRIDVVRGGGVAASQEKVVREFAANSLPLSFREEIRLDLSTYDLQKGDEVRLTVAAVDERGPLESKIGWGEAQVLKVTDRSGLLSGLSEMDQLSAKQLETIIQRELGIGGDAR